jgi:S-layer protein
MTTSINYDNAVQELYVTYFGRPADPGGLSNFAAALAAAGAPADLVGLYNAYGSNPSVKGLVDSFGTSSESVKLYGDTSTQSGVQAFVNDVFQNLFGRSANAEGLSFWSNAILSGSVTQGDAALAIAAGAAQNTTDQGMLDAKAVANKVSVASQFTVDLLTQQQIAAYSGAAAAAAARTLLDAVSGTTDPSAFAQAIGSTIYNITNPTGSLSYYLTPGIDHLSATASGAAFEAVLDNAAGVAAGGAASTFNAGDSLVGVAGTNSLVLNDVGVGGYFALPSGLTLTNITLLQLQTSQSVYDPSVSNGAVDLSKSGFTTVEIWGAPGTNAVKVAPGALLSFSPSRGSVTTYGGATVEVTGDGSLQNEYAPANAIYGDGSTKSVEINSGWNYLVQDANFGTGKSNSISSVTAQVNYGNININSDALTTLVAANEGLSNVITINAAAGARSLAISLDGDTGLTIVDRTATAVSIDTVSQANSYTNPVSSNLNLQFAAAQSVNIDASLGMNATTLYAPDASELSFDGSGYVTFASVTLHDGAHIDASGSNTAIAMSLHGSVSFTGGRGSDTITIDSAPAGPITGGVSSSNEIVLDNLGSVSASTLAQISKFATLGIAGSTSGTFDLSAMAGISVLDFHGASGTDTFTNVTQSTQVNITNGGSLNLSLQMADSHGYYNAMIVNIGGTGTTNFGIAQLTVGDAGGHGVDALDLAAVYGQHGVSYTFGGLSDIGLEDLGLTGYDAININTPIVDSSSLLSINSSAGNSGNYVAGVNDFNLTSLTLAGGVGLPGNTRLQ